MLFHGLVSWYVDDCLMIVITGCAKPRFFHVGQSENLANPNMAHNSQVRNGSYPMFGLIHVETGFCHPDFSGKQPQSMFETRKLTSDPSLHDQRQITHEPPSKLILYGAKMQAIILLAPHRSTVFCSNQNEIIQKCSGIVSSTSKVSLFSVLWSLL